MRQVRVEIDQTGPGKWWYAKIIDKETGEVLDAWKNPRLMDLISGTATRVKKARKGDDEG